jgi:protein-arginine kinase activator protein McsA
MMMDARARALDALGKNQHAAALAHVNRGLVHLTRFQEHRGRSARREDSEEFRILRTLRSEIVQEIPGDSTVGTRRALREAVLEERFEDAARLRDRLRATHAARDGESAPAP